MKQEDDDTVATLMSASTRSCKRFSASRSMTLHDSRHIIKRWEKQAPAASPHQVTRSPTSRRQITSSLIHPANPISSLAPYERRVIELLRNSKDKRARKLAKRRVRLSAHPDSTEEITIMLTRTTARYLRPCQEKG